MERNEPTADDEVVLVIETDGPAPMQATVDGSDDDAPMSEAPVSALVEAVLEAHQEREARHRAAATEEEPARIDGVVLGVVVRLSERGPVVSYRGCPSPDGLVARAACQITDADVGRRAALMFEGGNPAMPMLTGMLHFDDTEPSAHPALAGVKIKEDDQKIEIKVNKAISLSVGKASLIITPAGKIVIRGKYLLSRASGTNRVQGGSVRIN